MKIKSMLKNEDGSVMVLALVILVLLTLMGISATSTSTIEVQIATNNRVYKENLYNAEGGAMYAAQVLEMETDKEVLKPSGTPPNWLHATLPVATVSDPANWSDANSAAVGVDADNRYIVDHQGIARGSSVVEGASQLHEYSVYGLSKKTSGRSIILVGFRKRF